MKYLLLFLLIAPSAVAQTNKSVTRPYPQFTISASLGVSILTMSGVSNDKTRAALSAPNMRIGYYLNPRIALLLSFPGSIYHYKHSGRSRDRGFEGVIPSIQYKLSERWWMLAGAGMTLDAPAFYDIQSEEEVQFYTGVSGLIAFGYNLWQKDNKAIDLQWRWHMGYANTPEGRRTGNAFDLLVGYSWHR